HLVHEKRPGVEARFVRWVESAFLHDYEAVMGAWTSRCPELRIRVLDLDRDSIDERVADRWVRLQTMTPAGGYYIGLRADESTCRRVPLRVHGTPYRTAAGLWRIAPLAYWTTRDVAAYNTLHDLPRLAAYDAEGWETRTTSRVPRDSHGIRAQP